MRTDIRQAEPHDFSRLAEIELFNYRLNFYPIFKDDGYYFGEMNAADMINVRAIKFYQRHGFKLTQERKAVDETEEFLIKLIL